MRAHSMGRLRRDTARNREFSGVHFLSKMLGASASFIAKFDAVSPYDAEPSSTCPCAQAVQQSDGKLNVPPGSDSAVVAMLRTVLLPAPATAQVRSSSRGIGSSISACGAKQVVGSRSCLASQLCSVHAYPALSNAVALA